MARVILIHGWSVTDKGRGTIGKLAPYLEDDHEVLVLGHKWPWSKILSLLLQRRRSEEVAKELIDVSEEGDVFVCHSNGAWVAYLAMRKGAKPSQLLLFNPALKKDREFPAFVHSVDVFYSPNDWVVWLGKWLRRVPFSPLPWGEMGRVGYTGDDPRVVSHNLTDLGHSGVFKHLDYWGPTTNMLISLRRVQPSADNA